MLAPLIKFLQALSNNTAPGQIAHGFALGMILGLLPKDNLLWYLIFVFFFFFRIQRGVFSLSVIIWALIAPLLDPYFDYLGCYILTYGSLQPLFRTLVNIPFVAFTGFNNSVVMGSFVCGVCAYIPIYVLTRLFVFVWRKYLAKYVRKLGFLAIVKQLPGISKVLELVEEYV
ncbi:MAG: TIGR03546 family protein [Treponema sp.]|nr:TIGR03546 family protein [Treponema sp.]